MADSTNSVKKQDTSFFKLMTDGSGDLAKGVVKAWVQAVGAVGGGLKEWSDKLVDQIGGDE